MCAPNPFLLLNKETKKFFFPVAVRFSPEVRADNNFVSLFILQLFRDCLFLGC